MVQGGIDKDVQVLCKFLRHHIVLGTLTNHLWITEDGCSDGSVVNREMTWNEKREDNLRPCWTMNQSFVIFYIYFYSCPIKSTGCKFPCFVHELLMCDQSVFSPPNIEPHVRDVNWFNTKLSELTKWEIYGRQENHMEILWVKGCTNLYQHKACNIL